MSYIALATITLTGIDSEIVFSSIPATYKDLILISSPIHSGAGPNRMLLNGDSGANYPFVQMGGVGSGSGFSNSGTQNFFTPFTNSDPGLTSGVIGITQIMDYAQTDKHKTILMRNSSEATSRSPMVAALAARWTSTNAVTSITIYSVSTTMAAGSTFSLYGVA
jgi:hypothetical protein